MAIILAGGLAVVGLLVFPCLGALFGGVGGWIVGIFFGDAILGTFAAFGVKGISMWQLGITLGFISGFIRPSVTAKDKDA